MTILHMETDLVQDAGNQLGQTVVSLQQHIGQLEIAQQMLAGAWQSSAATIFQGELQSLLQLLRHSEQTGLLLKSRLYNEVVEWEAAAMTFGAGGIATAVADGISGLPTGTSPASPTNSYHSPYDVDSRTFRLNSDELIDFRPEYNGDELGAVMKDLNAFLAANHDQRMSADNPELIQRMADALGMDYQEAQHQYSQLIAVMANSNQERIDDLSTIYELKGHWGSRRQLLFGKVVGDSLGLHPAFAAMLSPSGGLIGPADGLVTLGLDGNLSGVIDENAWDYHGAAHDAAGYLLNNHGVGPGYEYINDGALAVLNKDGLDSSNPLSGQLSGYLFWAHKMGVSTKDLVDQLVKASIFPIGGPIL